MEIKQNLLGLRYVDAKKSNNAEEMQELDAQHNTAEMGTMQEVKKMLCSVNGNCLWQFYFILA